MSLEDAAKLTAVGRSDDGLVRVKIDATGCPIGFKLAAEHPPLDPGQTLGLALEALRDAHERLKSRTGAVLAERVGDVDGQAAKDLAQRATADHDKTLAELERYAVSMRTDLEQTMSRLARMFKN